MTGKHKGKTLPQILLSDPDWFFYAIDEKFFIREGMLKDQSVDLDQKARNIKIPDNVNCDKVVEYSIHLDTGAFSRIEIIPKSMPKHDGSTNTIRSDTLDMRFPRGLHGYDQLGYNIFLKCFKYYYFGSEFFRFTKRRCEAFFSTSKNFNI